MYRLTLSFDGSDSCDDNTCSDDNDDKNDFPVISEGRWWRRWCITITSDSTSPDFGIERRISFSPNISWSSQFGWWDDTFLREEPRCSSSVQLRGLTKHIAVAFGFEALFARYRFCRRIRNSNRSKKLVVEKLSVKLKTTTLRNDVSREVKTLVSLGSLQQRLSLSPEETRHTRCTKLLSMKTGCHLSHECFTDLEDECLTQRFSLLYDVRDVSHFCCSFTCFSTKTWSDEGGCST